MKLKRIEAGVYETDDGRFRVEAAVGMTTCDAPHPDRSQRNGYCMGDEEHEYDFWVVIDSNTSDTISPDDFETKRAATSWLEGHLSREARA